MSDKRYLLIFPAIILLIFNSIFPLVVVLNYSFTKPFSDNPVFEGVDNYVDVLHSSEWWDAFKRNALFTGIALAIEVPVGLLFALLIRGKGKLIDIVSTVVIIPSLIPFVSVGILWRLMTRTGGPIPLFMGFFGVAYTLMTPKSAFWTLIIMDAWHWISLVFLLLSASLVTIPEVYYTAARIDGSTKWQTFRYITFPGIKLSLITVLLLRIIDSFKLFDENFILTGGGPGRSTELLSFFIIKKGIREWVGGFSAAASIIYLVIVILLCYLLISFLTKGKGMLER
ncbi:MAG: sugar ABC transporter permease [Spirochaetes bacterium]|nr:sugar ABC transporter permease [Spirochaetota bacterium]